MLSSDIHGTPGDDEVRNFAVAPKNAGALDSLYLTGRTDGVGAGQDDAYLLELLGTDQVQRFNTYGDSRIDYGNEVVLSGNKAYVVGKNTARIPIWTSQAHLHKRC